VLPFVDVLISDYSSIYHDFLLLDRPIVLIPYDYEEFARTQGFMYNYFANLPGPAVKSQKEFLQSLEDVLEGRDPYADKRRALQQLIHTHVDAGACRLVVDIIDERLGTDRNTPQVSAEGIIP
jgi:CDP-glycerol glycerophosphotransferase (TagB/SpsB family)